jgi:glyoxylase I family protein
MKIEHFAMQIEDPRAVAAWYVEHLEFQVRRSSGAPGYAHFLADASGSVMIEIYNNPRVRTPDYASIDPLIVHLAFVSDDLKADRDRLVAAGATVVDDYFVNPAGDELLMLRDPWAFAIQFVKRANPML